MSRALITLVVPEGLLLLAAAAAVRWPALLSPLEPVLPLLPLIVLTAGGVLAVRFQRSGVLAALAALAVAGGALQWGAPAPGPASLAIAVLLPANLLAFALLPERGILSPSTLRRGAAIAGQAAAVFVLARLDQRALLEPLAHRALTAPILPVGVAVGDVAFLVFVTAMGVLAVLLVRRPDPLTRGFLWAVASGLLALAARPGPDVGGLPVPTLLLTTAGLCLTVAVIETAYALAYRDALTGLPSRRALDDALRRTEGPFALAMVDVDHFKAVNDTHGHDVGDQVLRMVARQLEEVGEGGRAFRYGGEEFAILFPGRATPEVLPTLDDVRQAVGLARFTLRGADRPRKRPKQPRRRSGAPQLAVTVSMGVAHRAAASPAPEAVVKRADEALYRAKQGGRNRIASARAAGRS